MLYRIITFAALLLLAVSPAKASPLVVNSGTWLSATYIRPVEPDSKWLYDASVQVRLLNRPHLYNQSILGLGMLYQVNDILRLGGGYRYLNSQYNPDKPVDEHRSYQSIIWRLPLNSNGLFFNSLSTLMQRFRVGQNDMTLRFRQRTGLDVPLSQDLNLIMFDEILFSLVRPDWAGPSFLDQNRVFIGFRFPLSENTRLTIGYLNQYQIRSPNNIMNHILMMTFNF